MIFCDKMKWLYMFCRNDLWYFVGMICGKLSKYEKENFGDRNEEKD